MLEIIKDDKVPAFKKATQYSAGYDLYNIDGDIELKPMEKRLIDTGINLNMMTSDFCMCALVFPRSGVSLKTNLRVCNSVGLIDQDYRGRVKVIIQNIGQEVEKINHLDRIAQLVFMNCGNPAIKFVDQFNDTTERGSGGFGSTGI